MGVSQTMEGRRERMNGGENMQHCNYTLSAGVRNVLILPCVSQ